MRRRFSGSVSYTHLNPTLINFLDGCALSLPCQAAGSAPVGLMIAGSNGADRRILAIGLAVEEMLAG